MLNNGPLFQVIRIPRSGKRRTLSQQTQKDQELTADRIRLNKERIDSILEKLVQLCGASPQKKDLLVLAREIQAESLIRLDRLAKRNRDCLICWFCENWRVISIYIDKLILEKPNAFDSRVITHASSQKTESETSTENESSENDTDDSFSISLFNDDLMNDDFLFDFGVNEQQQMKLLEVDPVSCDFSF